jgi:hypothetical protein
MTTETTQREVRMTAPLMQRAANVLPSSYRADDNSIEIVWTTGSKGLRFDWYDGTYYDEELSLEPSAVRLERLNAGAPLLNSHQDYDLSAVLGSVVPGSVTIGGGEGKARVRLASTPDVANIVAKIIDGHIRNVSVGYQVHAFLRTETPGERPHMLATDWEPTELSMVCVGFDAKAQTRSGTEAQVFPCIVRGTAATTDNEEIIMPDGIDTAAATTDATENTTTDLTIVDQAGTGTAIVPADTGTDTTGTRSGGFVTLARIAEASRALGADVTNELLLRHENTPFTPDALLSEVTTRYAERNDVPPINNSRTAPGIVTLDERDKFRRAMVGALSARICDTRGAPADGGEVFGTRSGLEIARVYLERQGIRTGNMGQMELAGQAFGFQRHGAMTTSDFAIALQQAGDTRAVQTYENYEETWRPLARETTANDFRPVPIVGLVGTNEFQVIAENGEYTYGSFVDLGDSFKLWTAGKAFSFSRQLLINDQLGLIGERIDNIGEGASLHEANAFWAIINGNPMMKDGFALFSTQHGNLADVGDDITVDSVGLGRAAMRKQKNRDGVRTANITPRYLVVGPDMENAALKFLVAVTPNRASDAVPAWMTSLELIVEPRITGKAWYLFADPARAAVVQVAYLAGADRLYTDSRIGWDVDGIQYKGRIDFNAKALGYAGGYKNPGK